MPIIARHQSLIILLAALVAFGPLSIDMYLPSLPLIAQDLAASEAQIQLTISVFLAGLCVGMLVYGPLSDRFGRRRLLCAGILLYLLATLGCILAGDARQLIVWRLFQALGGAAASVLARTIVRDLFPLDEAARVLSIMHLVTMLATLAAPLLGSYLILFAGWRSLFVVLFVFAALCLLCVLLKVPETHPREARAVSVQAVFQRYGQMLRKPAALGFMLCMGLSFGGMFAFITASPFIYIEYFGISAQHYAWLFGLNIAGIILATFFNARRVGRYGALRMLSIGSAVAALAGIALIGVGFSGVGGLPAMVLCVALFVSVTGMLGANCLACLLSLYEHQAGAVAGLAVALQFGLGTLCSALVGLLHDGSPRPMCLVVGAAGVGCFLAFHVARRASRTQ